MATQTNQSRPSTDRRKTQDDDQSRAHETQRASVGRGWHGDPAGHAAAGRKGGQTVSRNREHMAQIGRKGGQTVSRNRDHMAQIGRKGGQARKETGESTPKSS
jgi:general stress protein YciG